MTESQPTRRMLIVDGPGYSWCVPDSIVNTRPGTLFNIPIQWDSTELKPAKKKRKKWLEDFRRTLEAAR